MTDPRSIETRTNDVAQRLAAVEHIATGASGDVVVMTDLDADDPRLDELIAQARREGRMLVTPWEEGPDGELIDTSAPELIVEPAATDGA